MTLRLGRNAAPLIFRLRYACRNISVGVTLQSLMQYISPYLTSKHNLGVITEQCNNSFIFSLRKEGDTYNSIAVTVEWRRPLYRDELLRVRILVALRHGPSENGSQLWIVSVPLFDKASLQIGIIDSAKERAVRGFCTVCTCVHTDGTSYEAACGFGT